MKRSSALPGGDDRAIEKKAHGDPLVAMLLPSVAGILLCLVLLCSTTWAWFSSTHAGATTPIRSADYDLTVTVRQGETAVPLDAQSSFAAIAGEDYTVTLTATGTASTGYCTVLVRFPEGTEQTLYTAQIAVGESLTFTVRLSTAATVALYPQWGTSARSDAPDLMLGGVLSEP